MAFVSPEATLQFEKNQGVREDGKKQFTFSNPDLDSRREGRGSCRKLLKPICRTNAFARTLPATRHGLSG